MRHIKLSKFTEDQVLEEIYSSKTFYNSYSIKQGYTKNNLKDHIDKALQDNLKNNLRIDMATGTVRDNEGFRSGFSNVNDWIASDDKDPLYELAHMVKCDAVRYYNNERFK
tara:strand:- start:679 stop:1011 length:333 start_codon:yes stop_codon:yes gene_type:complete